MIEVTHVKDYHIFSFKIQCVSVFVVTYNLLNLGLILISE